MQRLTCSALMYLSLAVALAGLLLPLLPATPFLLLAAWAAARSSPQRLRWIETHPQLGPVLLAWRQQRAVPRYCKWLAGAVLLSSWLLLLAMNLHYLILSALTLLFMAIAAFLWSRPVPTGTAGGLTGE